MLREPDEVEKRLRRDICERCGAKRGYPCRSRSGRALSDSHAARYASALIRGDVPVEDAPGE